MKLIFIEPIVRPADYKCATFKELRKCFNKILAHVIMELYPDFPFDLIKMFTSFVVWAGPRVRMVVDVYWPSDNQVYKGKLVEISTNKQHFEVRYTGWTRQWNEWIDINAHQVLNDHIKRRGRIFPANYATREYLVGPGMCSRSRRVKKQPPLRKGMWVVKHDNLGLRNLLSRIVRWDIDCKPVAIKINKGGMECEWVLASQLWIMNTPPRAWRCHCSTITIMRLRCRMCGAMWPKL